VSIAEAPIQPRFQVGSQVRVRSAISAGHCRTPAYIRGRTGIIESIQGAFRNPELRAYGGDGLPKQMLYLVRFTQRELWSDYDGGPNDTLLADVYEHWLIQD
jgi:nitrile hydratase